MSYDSWRMQTPEEYNGTEGDDFIRCKKCGVPAGEHFETCGTCEGEDCECRGEGCEYEADDE